MKVIRPLIAALLAALVLVVFEAGPAHASTVTVTPDRGPGGRSDRQDPGERLQPWGHDRDLPGHPADAAGDRRLRRHRGRGVRFDRTRRRAVRGRAPDARPKRRARGRLPRRPLRAPHLRDPGASSTQRSCPSPSWQTPPPRAPARHDAHRVPGGRRPRRRRPPATSTGSAEPASPSRTSIGCASGSRHPGIALPALAAHIHSGGRGENGDIVVALTPPGNGRHVVRLRHGRSGPAGGHRDAARPLLREHPHVRVPERRHPRQPHVGRSRDRRRWRRG